MSSVAIKGGYPIKGEINIQGSKNGALPVLAASILVKGITVIRRCPRISDVYCMLEILKQLGCTICWEQDNLVIDASLITNTRIPEKEAGKMRSSVTLLGALLGRKKEAHIPMPGGCSIGKRPIDIHSGALKSLSAEVMEEERELHAKIGRITDTSVTFPYPSVGATQNAILACVLSDATVVLNNCAREPEIQELCQFLNRGGARIKGMGSQCITVEGVSELKEIMYEIRGDRIVAGTYLAFAAATGGDVYLKGVNPFEMTATLDVFAAMDCKLKIFSSGVSLNASGTARLHQIPLLITAPYPGFPTDMQSQVMSVLTGASGVSVIKETVFEKRFQTARELIKMNADIKVIEAEKQVVIRGKDSLSPARVIAPDLRGGAALLAAALKTPGRTVIDDFGYVLRGYEDIMEHVNQAGGHIECVS